MTAMGASAAPTSPVQKSPWHSPVPYLFGGLAAMLGLIAFALLILACSYWRLSGHRESHGGDGGGDLELGEAGGGGENTEAPVVEEKYLVIMAGQEKPTFLATPMSSRASSFGSKRSCSTSSTGESTVISEEDFEHVAPPADQVH